MRPVSDPAQQRPGICAHGVLACVLLLAGSAVQAQTDDARAILKAMTDYVGSQDTIQLSFDSDIEIITPQLEKIQFSNSGEAVLQRPDHLYAHRRSGHADVELFYDGRQVTIHGNSLDGYARFEAPGTVDQLIEALRAGHGVALPGADLLLTNAYEVLAAGILEAKYLGPAIIEGRQCEHVAFRNHETDWQLWVEAGDRPAPCRLVITSKTVNTAPQYTLRIRDWKTGIVPPAGTFSFSPPAGMQTLPTDVLIELDELPQGAPAGGQP